MSPRVIGGAGDGGRRHRHSNVPSHFMVSPHRSPDMSLRTFPSVSHARRWMLAVPAAVLLLASAPAALAAAPADCKPRIEAGWIRLVPGGMMMGGFARLVNPCPLPAAVVSAESPQFGEVELHQSIMDNGVSRMRPVPRLEIPANGSAELRPGSYHLMLMQPKGPLAPGARVPITLKLESGQAITAEFVTRPVGQ
jgi:copper(I)-binding protein